MTNSTKAKQFYKMWQFWLGIFIIVVVVGISASKPQGMDSSKALNICSKVAQESEKLVPGTKVIDKEATEGYDYFKEVSDGESYIRNWRGKFQNQNVDFDCFITKDGEVTRLLANYGDSSTGVVWLVDDRNIETKENASAATSSDVVEQPEADSPTTEPTTVVEETKVEPEVNTPIAEPVPAPATTDTTAPSSSQTDQRSPDSGVTEVVSGYCIDGTYVTGNPSARGKANKCYGHGGWRDY